LGNLDGRRGIKGLSSAIVPSNLTGSAKPYLFRRHPKSTRALRRRSWLADSRNVLAVAVTAAVVAQLAVAQVTLGLAAAFVLTAALSRWRPAWLSCPVLLGLGWAMAIGGARAWHGYLGGTRLFLGLLHAKGLLDASGPTAMPWHRWLLAQIPFALIAAAAEAGIVSRLYLRLGAWRPGLVVALRRCFVLASLRRGELATADGACIGVVTATGRRAAVSWREATGGVLVSGKDAAAVTQTGLTLAVAAILHRKTVIIVDLADGHGLEAFHVRQRVTSACADTNAPLAVLGRDDCRYEPFADAYADAAAGLVLSMIDWTGEQETRRAFCVDYVTAALEVMTTSATAVAPGQNYLDHLSALFRPGALEASAARVPDARLRRRAAALAVQLRADPSATSVITEQLAGLRRSHAGAALHGPWDGAETIDIGLALARRHVVLFSLGLGEHSAAGLMIARLVLADVARVLTDRAGAPADCLLWINGCDAIGHSQIAAALTAQTQAGVATIVSTSAGTAAAVLEGQVNVVATLADGRGDVLAVRVRGPVPRFLPDCRVAR
jgi:hypothetical protein